MFLSYDNVVDYADAVFSPFEIHAHKQRYTPNADTILVVNEHWMLRRVLPLLLSHPKKFILFLYHTDYDLEPQVFECLRHKVNHIYAEGCRITHPLITKIPVMNRSIPELIGNNYVTDKTIKCYLPKVGMFDDNNLHHLPGRILRQQCTKYFENIPFVEVESKRLSQEDFFKKVSKCKFVICPMGVGLDTPKIYEILYLGSTPIVIKNGLEDMYENIGGILVVESWADVTEELLNNYKPYKPPDEVFTLEYWLKNTTSKN